MIVSCIRRCWESKSWITEANNDSCNLEGEKDDRRIDDLLAVCVAEEAAGLAAEDMFEATPFGFSETPIAS